MQEAALAGAEAAVAELQARVALIDSARKQRELQLAAGAERNAELARQSREEADAHEQQGGRLAELRASRRAAEAEAELERAALARLPAELLAARAGRSRAESSLAAERQLYARLAAERGAFGAQFVELRFECNREEQALREAHGALRGLRESAQRQHEVLEQARLARQAAEEEARGERLGRAHARNSAAEARATARQAQAEQVALAGELESARTHRDEMRGRLFAATSSAQKALANWKIEQENAEKLVHAAEREREFREHHDTLLGLSRSERAALEADLRHARLVYADQSAQLAALRAQAAAAASATARLAADLAPLQAEHARLTAEQHDLGAAVASLGEAVAAARGREGRAGAGRGPGARGSAASRIARWPPRRRSTMSD